MKEVKYIPGDLVMTNGVPLGTSKNVVYRVISSDPSKTLKLYDGTVLKGVVCLENIEGTEIGDKGYLLGDCCAWVKDIDPIPLTPEILEKNGWGKDYCIGNEDRYTKYDFLYISYYRNDNTTKLFVKGLTLLSNIKYVHQLQHLLFGLGLPMDLKV